MPSPALSLLTLNIGNPSVARARRQLAWLIRRDEQVLVLTETKASAGCRLLAGEFTAAGYAVHYPEPGPGEYGTMIVATVPVTPDDGFGDRVGYLPARAAAAILPAPGGPLRVIGLYVPARDASIGKTERKRKWLAACDAALAAAAGEMPAIVLGDLNVLEPGHRPGYPFFEPFEYDFYRALAGPHRLTDAFRHLHPDEAEYSWVGRVGDGYRYDHAFCCRSLSSRITACDYLHQPREDGLSDHSALTMTLAITPPAPLPPPSAAAGDQRGHLPRRSSSSRTPSSSGITCRTLATAEYPASAETSASAPTACAAAARTASNAPMLVISSNRRSPSRRSGSSTISSGESSST
jgi:exodeoxyribonuclease-3